MGGGGGRVLTGLHDQAGGAHLLVMDEVFALGEVNCAARVVDWRQAQRSRGTGGILADS